MKEDSREEVPRIHLESIKDWERVKSNVTQAMDGSLERTGEGDPAIKAHLEHWVQLMLEDAKLNLRANGRDVEEYEGGVDDTEPYDEVLDRRIWTLSKEKIAWDRTLAERRTVTPREIERLMRDLLKRQREQERAPPKADENAGVSWPENPVLASAAQASATQSSSMTLAGELQQNLPALLERSERVKTVAREVSRMQHGG